MANDDVIDRADAFRPAYGDRGDMVDLIADLAAELRASRARVAELEQLVTRMSILGHSAFQGGWSRVDEAMREFDRLYDAAMAAEGGREIGG